MRTIALALLLTAGCSPIGPLHLSMTEGDRDITLDASDPSISSLLKREASRHWAFIANTPFGDGRPLSPIRFTAACPPDGRPHRTADTAGQVAGLFYRDLPEGIECFDPDDGQVMVIATANRWTMLFSATCDGMPIHGTITSLD